MLYTHAGVCTRIIVLMPIGLLHISGRYTCSTTSQLHCCLSTRKHRTVKSLVIDGHTRCTSPIRTIKMNSYKLLLKDACKILYLSFNFFMTTIRFTLEQLHWKLILSCIFSLSNLNGLNNGPTLQTSVLRKYN